MSPEHAMEGLFSEKSDVYSLGVLLLEIISGKRNTSFRNDDQSLSLIGYVSLFLPQNLLIYLSLFLLRIIPFIFTHVLCCCNLGVESMERRQY